MAKDNIIPQVIKEITKYIILIGLIIKVWRYEVVFLKGKVNEYKSFKSVKCSTSVFVWEKRFQLINLEMESLSIKDPQKLSIKGNTNEGYGNLGAGKIINRFYMWRKWQTCWQEKMMGLFEKS